MFRLMRATGASASLTRQALLTCTIVVAVLSGSRAVVCRP